MEPAHLPSYGEGGPGVCQNVSTSKPFTINKQVYYSHLLGEETGHLVEGGRVRTELRQNGYSAQGFKHYILGHSAFRHGTSKREASKMLLKYVYFMCALNTLTLLFQNNFLGT